VTDRTDRGYPYPECDPPLTKDASDISQMRDLAQAVVGGGWGLLEMRPMHMSLEDIFLSLTTDEAPEAVAAGEEAVNA
jgi:hypothetical protein